MTAWNGAAFSYDRLNSMFRLTNGSEDWLFAYTADDERIMEYRVGGGAWRTALRDLDGKILREYRTEQGGWTAFEDFVYRQGTLVASIHPTEGTRYFGPDHLDTPRAVFNTSGTIVAAHTYYPFGEEATPATQDTQQMKFTGHERDLLNTTTATADDTDYMHHRQFSILTGRFQSFDPIGGNPRAPQSWNRYAYVLGNPMKYVDPYGLFLGGGNLVATKKWDDWLKNGGCPNGSDCITVTGNAPNIPSLPWNAPPISPIGGNRGRFGHGDRGPGGGGAPGGESSGQLTVSTTLLALAAEAAYQIGVCTGAMPARSAADDMMCQVAMGELGGPIDSRVTLIDEYLGPGARAFRSSADDLVIESADGLRQVRFDLNSFSPHQSPHMHVVVWEWLKNKKREILNRRIFPHGGPG